ncbi:ABC transporter substrate-binding protein [Cellulomonas sp. PhB143]|uniref:peptide ABC transporter substrate-binding protein n=1 Tax=Cellulomonas sp. PhB143 TaxID=2485186 RepID=UPI000F4A25F1|nr:ABC transporter substrate-binding protein [Cellulomonas sp. PhB143]ROS76918.1 oligopeptide transport system substrate-binding protein [Cellulomonas sp. PhB143]
MKIQRFAGLTAVVAAGALALTACSSSSDDDSSSSDSASSGTSTGIVSVNGTEPQNPLIPANTNEVGGGLLLDQLFSGLVYYDAKGATHNEVAESIDSDDQQTWTIKIKDGWTFSDGTPVTASSFVDSWNWAALLSNATLSSYFFDDIEGFSYDKESALKGQGLNVVDDHTFTVKLKQPESDYPLRLGYSAFYPLPESFFDDTDAFGENPVGNGPYLLDKWTHDAEATFKPNPDYKGERTPKNGGIDVKFYQTEDSSYNDLLSGQLDIVTNIPASAFDTFKDDLGDRAVNQPAAIFQSFTIPQTLAHFKGEEGKLRRAAISEAIDRKTITDAIFAGTRTPAKDFTSPVIDGWSDSIPGNEVLDFDAAKAKDLWAQADAISKWPADDTFTIAYNSDSDHQAWVDATTNSIKNVLGIKSEGQPYPSFADLRQDITDRKMKGAFRSGWQADYPSLSNFLGPLYKTGAGSNDGDYSNKDFDALLDQAGAASSIDDANKLYQQSQEMLFKDLPAIPLWYSNVTGGSAETVDNVEFGWNSVPILYEVTKN